MKTEKWFLLFKTKYLSQLQGNFYASGIENFLCCPVQQRQEAACSDMRVWYFSEAFAGQFQALPRQLRLPSDARLRNLSDVSTSEPDNRRLFCLGIYCHRQVFFPFLLISVLLSDLGRQQAAFDF
jgi:hypothetical protein